MMRVLPRCDGLRNSLIILLLIFQFSYAKISAVAIFRRDEVDLHKYSAVLAAIEPFRLQLGDEIKKSLNPVAYAFHKIKGTNLEDPENGIRNQNKEIDVAYSRYEGKINDIVRAAADLESHIKSALPVLPFGTKSIFSSGNFDQSDDTELFQKQSYKDKNSEFSRFCKAIRTIERERIKMRERLQTELGISVLPDRMCDPDIRPVMCKQVQMACMTFPTIVSKVVDFYDLQPDTFEKLFEKHNADPIYRFRVHREIDKIEKLKRTSE